MPGIVRFPDGNHFSSSWLTYWSLNIVAGYPSLRFAGYFASSEYTYTTCQNSTVAALIINLLDNWMVATTETVLDIGQAVGTVIYVISPVGGSPSTPPNGAASGVSGNAYEVDISGQNLSSVVSVKLDDGLGNAFIYPATIVDDSDLSFNYGAELPAGMYNVALLTGTITVFTLPASLILS